MKIRNRKNGFSLLDVIIIIVVTGIASALTTGLILFSGTRSTKGVSYLDMSKDPAVRQFLEVYSKLLDDYYQDVNKEEMIASAINGMMEYLGEDYSTYLNQDQTQALAERIAGYYEGIGISIKEDNTIEEVHENSPAAKAGLQNGDRIIKINDTDMKIKDQDLQNIDNIEDSENSKKPSNEVTEQIRKMGNNKFSITVTRGTEELTFELQREKILYPVVEREIIEKDQKKIGYVTLDIFSQTSPTQIENAITKLNDEGMEVLILDLRWNSGGLLTAAEEIASQFIEKDKIILSEERIKAHYWISSISSIHVWKIRMHS